MNIRGGFMGRLQQEEASFALSDLPPGSTRMLWRYVRPYLGRFLIAVVFMLVAAGASLAMPLLAKVAVDD